MTEQEKKECEPCKIAKGVCRLLDGDKKGKCFQIYEAIERGDISGGQGKQALEEAFGAERVHEALKLASEIERRGEEYKKAMSQFLAKTEEERAASE